MAQAVLKNQAFIGIGKEAGGSWGVAASITDYFPMLNPAPKDKFKWLPDDGMRGTPALDQGLYQGYGEGEVQFETYFYPDTTGILGMAYLGTDTISGGGPYTHPLTMAAVLPPSYTIVLYDGVNTRQWTGCYLKSLVFKITADGHFTVTALFVGKFSGTTSKPTPAFSTQAIFIPPQGVLTLGGSSNVKLYDLTLTMLRNSVMIPGIGQQQPQSGLAGFMSVKAAMIFAPYDYTELTYFLSNTQPIFSQLFTSGANTLTIQMSKFAFEDPTEERFQKEYLEIGATARGIYNATDGGPIKLILVNPRSTSY